MEFSNNLDLGGLEICQLEELHLRLLAMCKMKTQGRLPQNLQSNFDPSRSSFHCLIAIEELETQIEM